MNSQYKSNPISISQYISKSLIIFTFYRNIDSTRKEVYCCEIVIQIKHIGIVNESSITPAYNLYTYVRSFNKHFYKNVSSFFINNNWIFIWVYWKDYFSKKKKKMKISLHLWFFFIANVTHDIFKFNRLRQFHI